MNHFATTCCILAECFEMKFEHCYFDTFTRLLFCQCIYSTDCLPIDARNSDFPDESPKFPIQHYTW